MTQERGKNQVPLDVADFVSVVEEFCRRETCGRPGPVVAAELIELRRACDLLELEFSRLAAEFADTDEAEMTGSISPIDWIRHHCKLGSGAAADRVCVGRQLTEIPWSAEAMAGGEIGFQHLTLIARTADAVAESETSRPFSEHRLLELARESSVSRFRRRCADFRHAQDQEAFAADEAQVHEARFLDIRGGEGGGVYVKGMLDAVGGATLRAALDPLAQRSGEGDERRHGQRMADALVELASTALDTGRVPQRGSQRPHLQVTTTLETLLGMEGAPAGEVEMSLPISAKAVERLACDCTVTRVLLGSDSQVIDVGRERRVVSGALRKALNVRDSGCVWPGCNRPASSCAGHHLVHWIRGGPTDRENTALLCGYHHRLVHEGGWQMVRTEEKVITIPPRTELEILLNRARAPDTNRAA